MRISYWSADVCSSYLGLYLLVERVESRIGHVHPSQTHLHRMWAVEVNPDRRSVPFCQQIRLGASRFDTGSAGQRQIFVERLDAVGDLQPILSGPTRRPFRVLRPLRTVTPTLVRLRSP